MVHQCLQAADTPQSTPRSELTNRPFAQLLSGLEMGHPGAVGRLPAFDFHVSNGQKAVFLISVSDCSECNSSALDHPNSSWSIARLKEYLRRIRGHI